MTRGISGGVAAEAAKLQGTEPIIIVEVTWGYFGPSREYADRDFDGVDGKILSVSDLDSVIKLGSTGASGGITVELDDTDGTIKGLLNDYDVHKGAVKLYQAFGDAPGERGLLFKGQINTPITWSEANRSVRFEAVSFIEDREIGFSPEQGEFDFIAESAVGKAWPLCFGEPIRVPAVKITEAVRGTSLSRYGLVTLSNLETLCSRAESFSAAERAKDAADVNPGFSDANYATVINNYNAALESLVLFTEALISDSPTQEAQIRQYAEVCKTLEKEEANQSLYANNIVQLDEAIALNEQTIASLQAQIAQKQAEVPPPTAEIAALQQSLQQQQDELADNENDRQFNLTLLLATNANIAIFEAQKSSLENTLTQIVITEIIVDGGENFPQGEDVTIIVKGAKFRGQFSGRTFTIAEANLPFYTSVGISAGSNPNEFILSDPTIDLKGKYCFFPGKGIVFCDNQVQTKCIITPILFTQTGALDPLEGILINGQPVQREIYDPLLLSGGISEVSVIIRPHWRASIAGLEDFANGLSRISDQDWSLEIGDVVYLDVDFKDVYIANLIESTSVLEVLAFRTINGVRSLVPIPTRYYTVNLAESIAGQTATTIRFHRPLDEYVGENWEKDIFVSLISSVGPNTVDIVEYLVDTYTDFDKDTASFASVKTELDPFPSHFAILTRPNALQTIENIMWQARGAAFLSNEKVKLVFLAKDESTVVSFTEALIHVDTLELLFTETEDLVTKFVAKWRTDYVQEAEGKDPNEFVLRNNIPKYGEIVQEYDFFIYNIEAFVEQSAFFWMVRYSSTWKRLKFQAFLDQIDLETFDPVEIALPAGVVADGNVNGYILSAIYNSETVTIDFDIWVSVRAGEMDTYVFAYPASAPGGTEYPTADDPFAGGASG